MKKIIFLLLTVFVWTTFVNAQSIFKHYQRPVKTYKAVFGVAATVPDVKAWRIMAPMVGYLYTKGNSQIATAIGAGYNDLAWDTTNGGSWYTKFSINLIAVGGGNIAPQLSNPASVISVGLDFTFMKHFSIGPVYNFPKNGIAPDGTVIVADKSLGKNLGVFAMYSITFL